MVCIGNFKVLQCRGGWTQSHIHKKWACCPIYNTIHTKSKSQSKTLETVLMRKHVEKKNSSTIKLYSSFKPCLASIMSLKVHRKRSCLAPTHETFQPWNFRLYGMHWVYYYSYKQQKQMVRILHHMYMALWFLYELLMKVSFYVIRNIFSPCEVFNGVTWRILQSLLITSP